MRHQPPTETAPSNHVGMRSTVVLDIGEVNLTLTEGQFPDLALNPTEIDKSLRRRQVSSSSIARCQPYSATVDGSSGISRCP